MRKFVVAASFLLSCFFADTSIGQQRDVPPGLRPLEDDASRATLFSRVEAAAIEADPSAQDDNTQTFNLYGPFAFPTDAEFDLVNNGARRVDSFFGVDVSHYTPRTFPIEILRNKQILFIYMKASQGAQYVDTSFKGFWDRAGRLTGNQRIHRGAYHFLSSSSSGESQAQTFLRVLRANGGLRDTDMPPVVDLEWDVSASRPGDAWKNVDPQAMLTALRSFLAAVEADTHRVPMIYTARAFLDERFGSAAAADAAFAEFTGRYPIWIADYSRKSRASETPKSIAATAKPLWQFTSGAKMAIGFGDTTFDASIFKGKESEFLSEFGVKDFM